MERPAPPRCYPLYITGSDPVTLTANKYDTVIQTDTNTVTVNLPPLSSTIAGFELKVVSTGDIILNPASGDTLNDSGGFTLSNTSATVIADPSTRNWVFAGGSSNIPGVSPYTLKTIYVRQGGNNIIGDGTVNNPFQNVIVAMETITNAAYAFRYLIDIGPGIWEDNFTWKAWVFMRGAGMNATILSGNIDIDDPSWSDPGDFNDEEAGAQMITFNGNLDLNFHNPSSPYGKIFFTSCVVLVATVTAFNSVNRFTATGCIMGTLDTNGGQLYLSECNFQTGSITFFTSSINGTLDLVGGGYLGFLIIDGSLGSRIVRVHNCDFASLTLTGASASLTATSSSLPTKNNITVSGGATLTRLSDAYGLGYTPTVPSNWAVTVPTTTQSALDRMSSLLVILNGGAIP